MPLPLILQLLMPLLTHLVDHFHSKDTSAMSDEEAEAHEKSLACAHAAHEAISKLK